MQAFNTRYFGLIVSLLYLLSPLATEANSSTPNYPSKLSQAGWSSWRRKAEMPKADFDSGFSNLELGGYLDFENACTTDTKLPSEKIDYWFRLSNSISRIGTGRLEVGCWFQGRFLHTYSSTAIKKSLGNVNCLRVNTFNKKGLVIWQEPRSNSRKLGTVAYRKIVRPNGYPASIVEINGENWLAIASPKTGWVNDGSFASRGNLQLCSLKNR